MTRLTSNVKLSFELTLTINESAAHALDAIAGYGDDAFLNVFYDALGRAYLRPHEGALRELLQAIREQLPAQLAVVKSARGKLVKP